jgi:non-heme chloroperoxidase
MEILVGQNDELFIPENFSAEFKNAGKLVPVTIVPATGHINLTLLPIAVRAAVDAIDRLDK